MSTSSTSSQSLSTTPVATTPLTKLAVVTIVVSIGLITNILSIILIPLLPALQAEFTLTAGEVTWLVTLPLLVSGGASLIFPRMADLVGDRRANVATMVFLTVGCAIPAIFNSYFALLIGLVFIGIGTVGALLGFALLRRHLPGDNAIKIATGAVTAATGAGLGAGLVLGGLLTEKFDVSVSSMFLGLAVTSALVTAATQLFIPKDGEAAGGKLGVVNVFIAVAWTGALLFGLAQGQTWGWTDWRVLCLIVGGVAMGAVWVRLERGSSTPIFDVDALRNANMRRALIAMLAFGLSNVAFLLITPFVAQLPTDFGGLGLGVLSTGYLLVPWSVAYLLGGIIWGYVKVGAYPLAAAGFTAEALAFVSLAVFHDAVWQVAAAAALQGITASMATAALFAIGQSAVPEHLAGMATSMLGMALVLGSSIGGPILSMVLAAKEVPGAPGVPANSQFVLGFLIAAAFLVIAVIACFKRSAVQEAKV